MSDAAADVLRRSQLAEFLRTRRGELQPEDLHIPRIGRRRVSGLRRHEVADLAGVSVTWYTWLEQARDIRVSPHLLDAVARALALDDDGWRYVRRLAGVPVVELPDGPAELDPLIGSMVDDLLPNPACLTTFTNDLLAWNESFAGLVGDPMALPPEQRNATWLFFMSPVFRGRIEDWTTLVPNVAARLRVQSGRYPGHPRFAELVADLQEGSPEFRAAWEQHEVQHVRLQTLAVHADDGSPVLLRLRQLHAVDSPGLTLTLYRIVGEGAASPFC